MKKYALVYCLLLAGYEKYFKIILEVIMQGKNLMQFYSLKELRKSINFASKGYKKHTKMTSRVKIKNIKYQISTLFLKDHFGKHM